MKLAVLSHSGGMDSSCLLVKLLAEGYKVKTLSFYYGQKHSHELKKSKELVDYLNAHSFEGQKIERVEIDLSSAFNTLNSSLLQGGEDVPTGHYEQENMVQTVVPNRNAIFSSIVYAHAVSLSVSLPTNFEKSVSIFMGIHSGDHAIYPDCRPEFREKLEEAFKLGNWGSENVNFEAPYLHGNKTTILEDCLFNCEALGLDFDKVLSMTSTSYSVNDKGEASGMTGSDIERIEAFLNIGRIDPVPYEKGWEFVSNNAKKILA